MNKKIFIDCGANRGQSIDNFINKWNDWKEYEILSFEGNPGLATYFNKYNTIDNIKFYSKAVWIHDGSIEFYLSNDGDTGSSIIGTKQTARLDKVPTIVECVDIDKIIRNYSKEDYIILKIDVEGAEYEILEHMLAKGTFEYVNVLYLEFHNYKVQKSKDDDNRLLNMLKQYSDLQVFSETYNHLNFV